MHYYCHHIGDFLKATSRLTDGQSMAYLRLLWMYYDKEQPLPNNFERLAFQAGIDQETVKLLLESFFFLENDCWRHSRCDKEITDYRNLLSKRQRAGQASAERRSSRRSTDDEQVLNTSSTDVQLTNNHKPITNNHKPKRESQRGTRLDPDFALPAEWAEFCGQHRPDLQPRQVFEGFRDYWIAQPGQKGVKTDWAATWRNWIRRQDVAKKTAAEERRNQMAELTRGLSVPKPKPKPFWSKPESEEIPNVESKRLL